MLVSISYPRSPQDEINGLPYFLRMCHKIRLNAAGELHAYYQPNLGKALDLYTCQLLEVKYQDLEDFIAEKNADDRKVIDWCYAQGRVPEYPVCNFVRNLGFGDHFLERLEMRKREAGLGYCDDIHSSTLLIPRKVANFQ